MATDNAPLNQATATQKIFENLDSLLGDIPEAIEANPEEPETEAKPPHDPESKPAEEAEGNEEVDAASTEDESTEDDQEEGVELNLENLARHFNVEVDDLYDLQVPTKVNGEESVASLREVVKNYQLESAINQKSMKLSDELKSTEAEREKIRQERESYQSQLAPLMQHLQTLVNYDDQINWEQLAQENPELYAQARSTADAHRQALNQSAQEYQKMQEQNMQEHVTREFKRLPEVIPEWEDTQVMESERPDIISYMKNSGYSDNDIQSMNYGKAEWIATVRKAMLFDKAKNSAESKKKVSKAPKLKVKSGAARSKKEDDAEARKIKLGRLRDTGKADDAAALIYDLID